MIDEKIRWFELSPVDAWFFRDGRPSNRDEDQSDLQSLFPPPQQTIVGAIRAAAARAQGWTGRGDWPSEIKLVLGDGFENLGQLSFEGPFMALDGAPLLPAPRHLIGYVANSESDSLSGKRFQPAGFLKPSEMKVRCDLGNVTLPVIPSDLSRSGEDGSRLDNANGFYLTVAGMEMVLNGELPAVEHCVHESDLFVLEPRIGISRQVETRTTGENAMYHPSYLRLNSGVSVLIGVAGLPEDWFLPAFFPLGGESRMASAEEIASPNLPCGPADGDVLVLVTPAKFDGEFWYGASCDQSASLLSSKLSGAVQTAALDRPLSIGGFDSRKGSKGPLPLQPYVPAGSVWWLGENAKSQSSSSRSIGVRNAYGFGSCFVAKR